jgi:hypothetical protein
LAGLLVVCRVMRTKGISLVTRENPDVYPVRKSR